MLDRTDFESWQQRIRLYCLGKDNGENIMKSIKEGPFHMGTISDIIAGGTEGLQFKTSILLSRLYKGKYKPLTHQEHYTDAKDIWEKRKDDSGRL
ncbi:hypothetical protein Tco_1019703 [Tanacetum coccineum]|uniref:Integrase, catalytic region, zinc finger, CCHC-type, peptidase aspartic, catalytic n=1 Tax=Tanacetum coccineum TaxID=301880 RepID=A0ABQ5FZ67_9ASTR